MARFDPNDYVDVQTRIVRFWSEYPDGRIVTYMISDPNIFERVVIRAEIYKHRDHPVPDATDLAAEEQGKGGMANATSWHENASTSAIGRALANMGFATTRENRPSRQEMAKVNHGPDYAAGEIAHDAPVRPQQARSGPQTMLVNPHADAASEKQIGFIKGLAQQKGISHEKLEARCSQLYTRSLGSLTKADASDLIDRLNAVPDPAVDNDSENDSNDSADMVALFNERHPNPMHQ